MNFKNGFLRYYHQDHFMIFELDSHHHDGDADCDCHGVAVGETFLMILDTESHGQRM